MSIDKNKKEQLKNAVIAYLDEAAANAIKRRFSATGKPKRVKRSTNLAEVAHNKAKRKLRERFVTKRRLQKTKRSTVKPA